MTTTTSAEALATLTGTQLKGIAKASGLSGYSALKKDDLVVFLDEAQTKGVELVFPAEDPGDSTLTGSGTGADVTVIDGLDEANLAAATEHTDTDTDTDTDEAPAAVRIVTRAKVQVEGTRWVRIIPGDVFRGFMAGELWRVAREHVEAVDG